MICQKCRTQIPDNSKVCPNCKALQRNAKFCQHCGSVIDKGCIVCPKCGKQVKDFQQQQPQIVINNSNSNIANARSTAVVGGGRGAKNKWVAFFLCLFLGAFGAHKFYEGKVALGVVYMVTIGLLGFGWFVDLIILLFKPNPYYV